MYSKRENLPEESDIVLCTVTKIQYHSVFVTLNEYNGKTAMLHISEISPGRIRNIGDFVKEGKVIVCKILKVDPGKGHIDVSLRRVTESQRRSKLETIKQEQKADKIIEFVAEKNKIDVKKLKEKIEKAVFETHASIYEAFTDISAGSYNIEQLALEKNQTETLKEVISQRIKPAIIEVQGKLKLESHESNGIDVIKSILKEIQTIDPEKIEIGYLGAGSYHIILTGEEYKELENEFQTIQKYLEQIDTKKCQAVLTRT